MGEKRARDEGDYFPFAQKESPTLGLQLPLPDPGTSTPAAGPEKGSARRGQRFSKLSDAYSQIAARATGSRPANIESPSSPETPATGEDARALSSSIGSARLVKSQDDLQTPSPLSVARSSMRNRRASFTTLDFFGDLPPNMNRDRIDSFSLSQQIARELANYKGQTHDTSGSTIENIVAQYHGPTLDANDEPDDEEERRIKAHPYYIGAPPQESLPTGPPTNAEHDTEYDVHQDLYESPVADTSVSDSQNLLDAEAQARELEEEGRAVVPEPLNIAQPSTDVPQSEGHDDPNESPGFVVYDNEAPTNNPFECTDYQTYLAPDLQRDISRKLRGAGDRSPRASSSPNTKDEARADLEQASVSKDTFTSFNTASSPGDRRSRPRNIRVVIGKESPKEELKEPAESNVVVPETGELASDDADWVTETSDAGIDRGGVGPVELPAMGYKKAGSSLADYSDDGNEELVDNFGSRERIIQYPDGTKEYPQYEVHRSKDNKFSVLLPRKLPEPPNRRNPSSKRDSRQFRPQLLAPKSNHPYREFSSRRPERLAFNFDENAPPRFAFRDSMSEYEPATASTKADCGTQHDGSQNFPQRPVSELSETSNYETHSVTDAQFDGSPHMAANIMDFNGLSHENNPYYAGEQPEEQVDSTYATERQRRRNEIERDFATATSYREDPLTDIPDNKFGYALLRLEEARRRNKEQRASGETDETETGMARMRRFRSSPSASAGPANTSSPIQRPEPAIITDRDLSTTFSPTDLDVHSENIGNHSTPHAIGRFSYGTPNTNPKRKTRSWLGFPGSGSSFGTPSVSRHTNDVRFYDPAPAPALGGGRRQHRRRPGYIAPDDYVSDSTDRVRKIIFGLTIVLTIISPFFGACVLWRCLSAPFIKWATQGEVDRLTRRQRCVIRYIVMVLTIIHFAVAVGTTVYVVKKNLDSLKLSM